MSGFSVESLETYWINLEHRQDRRDAMQAEIERVGLHRAMPVHRFSAMTKDDWREPVDTAPRIAPYRTAGQWLSMTYLMRLVQGTSRNIVILEDDLIIATDIVDRLFCLEHWLPDDWDIVALGATFHLNRNTADGTARTRWHPGRPNDAERTPMKHLFRSYGTWSNHGMIVRGQSAGKVLAAMRSVMDVARGSDHALILVQPLLQAYVFVPGCVFQRDGTSDVAEGGGFTRFSDFKKLGPYVFQDRLADWDIDGYDWAEADPTPWNRTTALNKAKGTE